MTAPDPLSMLGQYAEILEGLGPTAREAVSPLADAIIVNANFAITADSLEAMATALALRELVDDQITHPAVRAMVKKVAPSSSDFLLGAVAELSRRLLAGEIEPPLDPTHPS